MSPLPEDDAAWETGQGREAPADKSSSLLVGRVAEDSEVGGETRDQGRSPSAGNTRTLAEKPSWTASRARPERGSLSVKGGLPDYLIFW